MLPVSVPGSTPVKYRTKPSHAFLVKQWKNPHTTKALKEVAEWLINEHGCTIYIEPSCQEEFPEYQAIQTVSPGHDIDFAVVLGGDGTVLHLNSLFQGKHSIPPVFNLAMGSLGFLAQHKFEREENHWKSHLGRILNAHIEPINLNMRTRLYCEVFRGISTEPIHLYQALNETMLYRGLAGSLTRLDFFVDDQLATIIQADGVIIAAPTGSTAYSLSAGGPVLPPSAPVFLITPVCPHTLSFRPLILPDCSTLKLRVHKNSRASCLVSFDGRSQITLDRSDFVRITMSPWPMPTVSVADPTVEWFRAVHSRLHWNVRELQKSFEHGAAQPNEHDDM